MRPALTYRKPQQGRDYWVLDNVLPNAAEVAQRCFARQEWELGAPHRQEPWPGMRSAGDLLPQAWHEELRVENRFNRMLLYRANLVHSASSYFGCDHADKRMTAVFFWMA